MTKQKQPEMLASAITRDVAMRHIEMLEIETRKASQRELHEGKAPNQPAAYAMWVSRWDERFRALQGLRVLLMDLPPNTILLPAEWSAH
jgi:hypothetical protein